MSLATLFNAHIAQLQSSYERAILTTATPCDAVLIHSGSEQYTYADDRGIAFKSWGHFLHWLPVIRPDQMLLFVPGQKPVYFQVIPPDFWYEQSINMESWWADQFRCDIVKCWSRRRCIRVICRTQRPCDGSMACEPTSLRSWNLSQARWNPAKMRPRPEAAPRNNIHSTSARNPARQPLRSASLILPAAKNSCARG